MSDLRAILEQSRPELEAGIADAQRELAELHARQAELEALITRAKAALGELDIHPPKREPAPGQRLTLHEAMRLVLSEHPARRMTALELANAINERRLYEKRDGSSVEPGQIHARANKYPALFGKDTAGIWMRDNP